MNYKEATNLAKEWTKGHKVDDDGWRSVILLLYRRVMILESLNMDQDRELQLLRKELKRLMRNSYSGGKGET